MSDDLHPPLLALAHEARSDLKERIDFIFERIRLPELRGPAILWRWALTLAMLSYDVSGGAVVLSISGELRSSSILARCLFEYWVRLRFYSLNLDAATKDYDNADNRTRETLKAYGSRLSERVPPEVLADLADVLSSEGKIRNRSFAEMLNAVVPKDQFAVLYYTYYGVPSAFTHGNETAMQDVLREPIETQPAFRLFYKTPNFVPDELLLNTTMSLCHMIDCLAGIFNQGIDEANALRARLESIMADDVLNNL